MATKTAVLLPAPFEWIDIPGKEYSIAKYPLTNAQYAPFIAAGGYANRAWWSDAGWDAKLKGMTVDFMKGEAVATGEPWAAPRCWHDAQWNGAEQPVVGVSWYEATAYGRWLSEASGERIALPSEAQWQYAAQGDDGRRYPWGEEWDCTRCNNSVKPCQSAGTTPVRQYEGRGDSPFGAVDMAGNVWEWCATDYEPRAEGADDASVYRVLKGGGWFFFSTADCRCGFRYGDLPVGVYNFRGFRIARI